MISGKMVIICVIGLILGVSTLPLVSGFNFVYFNIIYVDDDGGADYTRIQDAIDNASPGDTVFVYSGFYNEFVWINKSINLIGEDRNSTVINSNGTGHEVVIFITSDYVSVIGFTIEHCKDSTERIIEHKSNDIVAKENLFSNNYYSKGLFIYRSSNNKIICNNISKCDYGIRIYGSNNNFSENVITKNSFGVFQDFSSHNNFSDNTVKDNSVGIFSWCSYFCKVYNNNILNNDFGFLTWGGTYACRIIGNTISNNKYGIGLECYDEFYTEGNSIIRNDIQDNEFGIYLHTKGWGMVDGNYISMNYITSNKYGIFLSSDNEESEVGSNNFSGNTIKYNVYGFYLNNTEYNIISSNNFIWNRIYAYFENCINNTWNNNYWNRRRLFPYLIFGKIMVSGLIDSNRRLSIPWVNFDWHPAREPYNIQERL